MPNYWEIPRYLPYMLSKEAIIKKKAMARHRLWPRCLVSASRIVPFLARCYGPHCIISIMAAFLLPILSKSHIEHVFPHMFQVRLSLYLKIMIKKQIDETFPGSDSARWFSRLFFRLLFSNVMDLWEYCRLSHVCARFRWDCRRPASHQQERHRPGLLPGRRDTHRKPLLARRCDSQKRSVLSTSRLVEETGMHITRHFSFLVSATGRKFGERLIL